MAAKRLDPRNKRTRPAKGEGTLTNPVQFYVDDAMRATIKTIAGERGITESEWLRRAVKAYQVKHTSRKGK